ncbi:hypothetical protein QZH41_017134 [Actinostola sp. cb2023]|nr:hypothetical protein QZH41_017134 [Actinostola sp. cb2023]
MNVIRLNLSRLLSCFYFVFNFIKKIFGRGRQRKKSSSSNALPVINANGGQNTIPSEGSNQGSEWVEWGNDEQFSIKIEPNPPPSDQQTDYSEGAGAEDLFKDMTPVFKKAKKIVIKSKQVDSDQHENSSPSRLNFDMNFPPSQTDLGSWEDTSGGWDENEISEREIKWETENAMKEKKLAERERRALEQQRRKEERESLRSSKKNQQQLGIKVNS